MLSKIVGIIIPAIMSWLWGLLAKYWRDAQMRKEAEEAIRAKNKAQIEALKNAKTEQEKQDAYKDIRRDF